MSLPKIRQGWWITPDGRLWEVEEDEHVSFLAEHLSEMGLCTQEEMRDPRTTTEDILEWAMKRGAIRLIKDYMPTTKMLEEHQLDHPPVGWGIEIDLSTRSLTRLRWKKYLYDALVSLGAQRGEEVSIFDWRTSKGRSFTWDPKNYRANPRWLLLPGTGATICGNWMLRHNETDDVWEVVHKGRVEVRAKDRAQAASIANALMAMDQKKKRLQ